MKIVPTCQLLVPGLASVFLLYESLVAPFQGAYAQVVPDASLGPESSIVTPDAFIRGDYADLIEGGATRGSALFHSFEDFSVLDNQRVYFANPIGIENILSRVTGLNPSQIDGLLGVDGAANLFFLNPNGIVFGPNARLDVAGAFLASTSDRFQFADGTEFRATDPNVAPLVTVNIPLGLQLGPEAPATLVNEANLAAGKDLTLAAGAVTSTGQLSAPNGTIRVTGVAGDVQVQTLEAQSAVLEAGVNLVLTESQLVTKGDLTLAADQTVQIRDSESAPFIAAARGDLLVEGAEAVDIFALNHPDSGLYAGGDLVLRSGNPVIGDAHYLTYGSFRIEDLEQNLGGLVSPHDPVIRASGDVSFISYEGASLHILAGGSVNVTDNITITGADDTNGLVEKITLSDLSEVEINGKTEPTLDIRAGTLAFGAPVTAGGTGGFIPDPPTIGATPSSANITIGSIFNNISNGRIFLTTQYQPNLALTGGDIRITGNNAASPILSRPDESISAFGNPVTIDARGVLDVAQNITSGAGGKAEGGDIWLLSSTTITTGSVRTLSDEADAGNVVIRGNTGINVAAIEAKSNQNGNSGFVILNSQAGGITIGNGSGFINSESNDGSASFVSIYAENDIKVGDVSTSSNSFAASGDEDGGGIYIFSNSGSITANKVETLTRSPAEDSNSGYVFISADKNVNTSLISTSSVGGQSGPVTVISNQGDIQISFDFDNDSLRSVTTFSETGKSGNVSLTADKGSIFASREIRSSTASGESAGNVTIKALEDVTTRGISTEIETGKGNSGSILIESFAGTITNTFSDIRSDANEGAAGNVSLIAEKDIVTTATISTTVIKGASGNISLTSKNGVINSSGNIRSDASEGIAGDVLLTSSGDIKTANLTTKVGVGSSGVIAIESTSGSIDTTLGVLNAESTESQVGFPGNITLKAANDIQTGTIITKTQTGNSGSIILESFGGTIDTSAGNLNSKTGSGDAGDVQLIAQNAVVTSNIATSVQIGNSGTILIKSIEGSIDTSSGNLISEAATGNAGDVVIIAVKDVKTADVTTQTVIGKSGNISITSETGLIDVSLSELTSKTVDGKAGTVILDSPVDISVQTINTSTEGGEPAADIVIGNAKTNTVVIVNGSVTSSSSGTGNSGSIKIQGNTIRLSGAEVTATASGGGQAGSIEVEGNSVRVSDSEVSTTSSGTGDAGSVTFAVRNNGELTFSNSFIASASNGKAVTAGLMPGQGGNINLSANTIAATDSLIQASAQNNDAGSVEIEANTSVVLRGTFKDEDDTQTNIGGVVAAAIESGLGGNVTIKTPALTVQDGAAIAAGATGNGDAGFVSVEATTVTLTNGGQIATVTAAGKGNPEGIRLGGNLQTLTVTDSQISASTDTGVAGGVTVEASDAVILSGTGGISASAGDDMATGGQGGSINIRTPELRIQGAEIAASAINTANAGAITIESTTVTLDDGGQITAKTVAGNAEKGIQLNNLQTLAVRNSIISASTETGKAGSILIEAADAVALTGTFDGGAAGISASAGKEGQAGGSGGDVELTTNQLQIQEGAEVAASAISTANAGRIAIDATTIAINNGGQITASTQAGQGDAAGIQLGGALQSLDVTDSLISSSTQTGTAGRIQITAADRIQLSGRLGNQAAGISAEATAGGTAGSVTLKTGDFQVRDGAAVTVSSPSGVAGSLTVTGDRITLSQGTLASEAGLGDGSANITLDLSRSTALNNFLWLENESLISANALGSATGGNIDIDADFIFGFYPTGPDGSDIVANAELGNGGAITIDALGVFGLQFRLEPTPLNDITASSDQGLQGSVALNTLATDPNSGLVELTLQFIDASKQALNQCSPSAAAAGSVIQVAGRGGLPIMPTAILAATSPEDDWVALAPLETGDIMSSKVEVLSTNAQFSQPPALCHGAYQASQIGL